MIKRDNAVMDMIEEHNDMETYETEFEDILFSDPPRSWAMQTIGCLRQRN